MDLNLHSALQDEKVLDFWSDSYKDDLLHFYLSLLHRQSEQVSIIHEMGWIPCCSNRRTLYHNLWTRPAFPMWIERGTEGGYIANAHNQSLSFLRSVSIIQRLAGDSHIILRNSSPWTVDTALAQKIYPK